uniref:COP9 signalosome complex subunit 5 n=1 Tax=Simocephalus serrulatus TaxID=117539 RepID=A0A4Y7NNC5_9CRUS|nr:EOG090X078Z [Simocephalus serrulatus]SVE94273.1 EOG090X078Z [Simocephalus serrulatus]
MSSQSNIALNNWLLANNVENISSVDEIYRYDKKQQQDMLAAKPWEKDPHFFKEIRISALALLKMVTHARSGGHLEVMGLLLGKVDANTMVVMDAFALPVEGTETRVNAQSQAYEYMTAYIESAKQVNRLENAIGWYHSHPGYGCWLSGIDVSTQMLNQNFQEPFVAIVVDPVRTISAGKGYKPPNEEPSEYQTIPLNKVEDFGVHCKQYYALEVSYFKSALDRRLLDSLWNKYWVSTLSSSSLTTNADYTTGQVSDLSEKLEQAESSLGRAALVGSGVGVSGSSIEDRRSEDRLAKAARDATKTSIEALHGLLAQVIKDRLFNQVRTRPSFTYRYLTTKKHHYAASENALRLPKTSYYKQICALEIVSIDFLKKCLN